MEIGSQVLAAYNFGSHNGCSKQTVEDARFILGVLADHSVLEYALSVESSVDGSGQVMIDVYGQGHGITFSIRNNYMLVDYFDNVEFDEDENGELYATGMSPVEVDEKSYEVISGKSVTDHLNALFDGLECEYEEEE